MTVAENMGFALKMQGVARDERARRVQEAAKLLDLDDKLLARKPKALSGGQRQRVAMGRAIVREPKVFLMDEPLSNLDAKLRVQTRSQIAELQRRLGVTTVYVTHDQVEAMTMGHRVAVLAGGLLQQCDTPRQLYDNPVNQFVAGFIGAFAEFVAVPAVNAYRLPDQLDGQLGAMAEPLACAVHGLRRLGMAGPVSAEPTVVIGAGTMGLLMLQLLLHAGAGPVAVVDRVRDPLEVARKLGAAQAVTDASALDGARFTVAGGCWCSA